MAIDLSRCCCPGIAPPFAATLVVYDWATGNLVYFQDGYRGDPSLLNAPESDAFPGKPNANHPGSGLAVAIAGSGDCYHSIESRLSSIEPGAVHYWMETAASEKGVVTDGAFSTPNNMQPSGVQLIGIQSRLAVAMWRDRPLVIWSNYNGTYNSHTYGPSAYRYGEVSFDYNAWINSRVPMAIYGDVSFDYLMEVFDGDFGADVPKIRRVPDVGGIITNEGQLTATSDRSVVEFVDGGGSYWGIVFNLDDEFFQFSQIAKDTLACGDGEFVRGTATLDVSPGEAFGSTVEAVNIGGLSTLLLRLFDCNDSTQVAESIIGTVMIPEIHKVDDTGFVYLYGQKYRPELFRTAPAILRYNVSGESVDWTTWIPGERPVRRMSIEGDSIVALTDVARDLSETDPEDNPGSPPQVMRISRANGAITWRQSFCFNTTTGNQSGAQPIDYALANGNLYVTGERGIPWV